MFWTESPCLLTTYAVTICLLLVSELVAAGLLFHFRNNIATEVTRGFEKAVELYEQSVVETEAIDGLQWTFRCCGLNDRKEWLGIKNQTYPASCCPGFGDKDRRKECSEENAYTRTCLRQVESYIYSFANSAAIAGIIVAIVQLAAIISSCLLAKSFRKHYNYV